MQVGSLLPGAGGPQAILRSRQKRQASAGFLRARFGCGIFITDRPTFPGKGADITELDDWIIRLAFGLGVSELGVEGSRGEAEDTEANDGVEPAGE